MATWWQHIKQSGVLQYNRSERRGLLFMALLALLFFAAPALYELAVPSKPFALHDLEIKALAELEEADEIERENRFRKNNDWPENKRYKPAFTTKIYKFQKFDPNTVSLETLVAMGLSDKTALALINFRSKGFVFKTPLDLKRVYGISDDWVEQAEPFVLIEPPLTKTQPLTLPVKPTASQQRPIPTIDINLGDTSAFMALPGIGSTLSNRIVNYRHRLGGFHSVTQIAEVYGITQEVFATIKPSLLIGNSTLSKIYINRASANDLSRHPYFSRKQAQIVIEFRKQHGLFKSPYDLRRVNIFDAEWVEKMAPYISVEE